MGPARFDAARVRRDEDERQRRRLCELLNVEVHYRIEIMEWVAGRHCSICGNWHVVVVDHDELMADQAGAISDAARELDLQERRCPALPVPDNVILGSE